jgi:hypothetical protein
MPSTNQETAPSGVPETLAASEIRCPAETVAEAGDTFTLILLMIATTADAEDVPEVTALAAA